MFRTGGTVPIVLLEDGEYYEDGNLLPPVDGMVGSPFMAKQKWVIDFGCMHIIRK